MQLINNNYVHINIHYNIISCDNWFTNTVMAPFLFLVLGYGTKELGVVI